MGWWTEAWGRRAVAPLRLEKDLPTAAERNGEKQRVQKVREYTGRKVGGYTGRTKTKFHTAWQ